MSRQQRKLENAFRQPREAKLLVFLFTGFGLFVIVGFIFVVMAWLRHSIGTMEFRTEAGINLAPEIIGAFDHSLSSTVWLIIPFLVILMVTMSLIGLALSHRLFGPSVQINRLIDRLKTGEYGAQAKLRKGDPFQEVMDNVNSLSTELAKRHGAGTPKAD